MVCSHCGHDCQTADLIPICSLCSERLFLHPLNQQEFTYRRIQGQIGRERRGEIIRKIGQGRLTPQLEVIEGLRVIPLAQHEAFREIFISGTSVNKEVEQRKNEKEQAIFEVKRLRRKTFMWAFMFLLFSGFTAFAGFEKNLFVLDLEPEKTEPISPDVPVSFQEYLSAIKLDDNFEKKTLQEIETILHRNNPKDLLELQKNLEQELHRSTQRGDELLLYLQTLFQLGGENPTLGIWSVWAEKISDNISLKNRVMALWRFSQSDREGMKEALILCADDVFCKTMNDFLEGDLENVSDGFSGSFVLEKILESGQTDQYEKVATQIEKFAPEDSIVWALRADAAISSRDFKRAKEALTQCLRLNQANQQAQIWMLQLSFKMDFIADSSSWVIEKHQEQSIEIAKKQNYQDLLLARHYLEQEKWKEAKARLDLIFDPSVKDSAFLLKAHIALSEGNLDQVRLALKEVSGRSKSPNAHLLHGLLLVEMGDLQAASVILSGLESLEAQKWILSIAMAAESKNLPLLKKSLMRLSVVDLETVYLRGWDDSWVPKIGQDVLFQRSKKLIYSDIEYEKLEQMLAWSFNQSNFHPERLLEFGNADVSIQAIVAQYSMNNDDWNLAYKTAKRAKVLAPNEGTLLIMGQIINAGRGDKLIASQELEILSQKKRTDALYHWFWKGFVLSDNEEKAKEYEELFWSKLPEQIVRSEYPLVWKEDTE